MIQRFDSSRAKGRVRVLLADPPTTVLDGLRVILEHDFAVAGQVSDGDSLVRAARRPLAGAA